MLFTDAVKAGSPGVVVPLYNTTLPEVESEYSSPPTKVNECAL